jgi:protein-S-isoprenylcysteine O-methyltransferase Ste14
MNNLLFKSMLGLIFLLAVLSLLLTVSAGSIKFWQAWAYLGVFFICTFFITAYLYKYDKKLLSGRIKAGPVSETQKSQKIIQSFASLFFIALFIFSGLDHRFHWSAVPAMISLIADGLVALGFYFVFLVFRENSFANAIIKVADGQKVVQTGPYSIVRHPMYAGAFVLLVFTPLALGSWVALPCVLPMMAVIGLRAKEEEKFLSEKLPGYSDYCKKVRYRFVPSVW